jgi:hypothetical protein
MLQILNPFKAGNEFQKLKSRKKWILALLIVLIPVVLSTVGTILIQQENQERAQQFIEERGSSTEEEGQGPRQGPGRGGAPMGGMFPFGGMFQGGGGMSSTGMMAIGIIFGFFSALIFWIVKSLVFHLGSKVLGGEPVSISSTIHVMAFTYIPFVFKGILDVIKGLLYEASPPMGEFRAQAPDTSLLLNFVRNHFTIFMVWALFLMVVAIKSQYNLSNKKAVLVVLVPYIVVWIIQLAVLPSIGFLGLVGGM